MAEGVPELSPLGRQQLELHELKIGDRIDLEVPAGDVAILDIRLK